MSSHQQGRLRRFPLSSDPVMLDVNTMRCRQARKGALGSSPSPHSDFAVEASNRLMTDDGAQLRTNGGVATDVPACGQLQVASAGGLRLREVAALHQGTAGAAGAVVYPYGGEAW